MTPVGFRIVRVALTGRGLPDAEIHLMDGLNVVTGPSDTGKTFIAQCLDYMMGASDSPKEIEEAGSYESVALDVVDRSGHQFSLARALKGGDFTLRRDGEKDRVLGWRHQPGSDETVSHLLLEMSGLAGNKVRVNSQGESRFLSFRDIARLVLVDEEGVISERSPIHSGQVVNKTVQSAVFRVLLSGLDDSAVIATPAPKTLKLRREGGAQMAAVLLDRTREQIRALKLEGDVQVLRAELARLEDFHATASRALAVEKETVAALEEERRRSWTALRHAESRANVLEELQRRFELLREQYTSDQKRLDAIAEAGHQLDQMASERCPVCGALTEHQDPRHQEHPKAEAGEVAAACRAEALKIQKLRGDLESTLFENRSEFERLRREAAASRSQMEQVGTEIRSRLAPRLQTALQQLADSQTRRDTYRRAIDLYDRIYELEALSKEEPTAKPRKDGKWAMPAAALTEAFCRAVERILIAWKLPGLDRVVFSETDEDLVISGRRRASHGKGVRAITHAAFNIGLMRVCVDNRRPHPGLVVVDSPLVVYKQPDLDEGGFALEVKDAFYRSLASQSGGSQVIIFENEDPPADVDAVANVIRFTGTDQGRRGFIPDRNEGL